MSPSYREYVAYGKFNLLNLDSSGKEGMGGGMEGRSGRGCLR